MTATIDVAAKAAWNEIARQNGENTSGYAGTYAGRPNYVEGFIDPVALARAVLMAVREPDLALSWIVAKHDIYDERDSGKVQQQFTAMIKEILREESE